LRDLKRFLPLTDSSPEQRQVSINNLNLIVNFCENMIECRRTQQLDYFGEHFTSEECLKNKATACDNCARSTQYKEVDATEIAKMVVSAVQDLCSGSRRFTVLHMVDVLKGAETKKVIESNHNNTKFHGHLKAWERNDIGRLIHKLIIENYLKEEIVIVREMAQSYLKIGPQVARLMQPGSQQRIKFALSEKNQKATKVDVIGENDQDDELRDRCYHDLMEIAQTIAEERGISLGQVMNMGAINEMSKVLPTTEEQMLQIPHVTKANFGKFGAKFLETTQNYAAMRELNRLDLAEEDDDIGDDPGGNVDWNAAGREATTSSSARRFPAGKRKFPAGGWGNSSKRYRSTSGGRSKKKSPAKKSKAASTVKGRGSKTGLMPRPAPKF
jgi:bloom syndrome protein